MITGRGAARGAWLLAKTCFWVGVAVALTEVVKAKWGDGVLHAYTVGVFCVAWYTFATEESKQSPKRRRR